MACQASTRGMSSQSFVSSFLTHNYTETSHRKNYWNMNEIKNTTSLPITWPTQNSRTVFDIYSHSENFSHELAVNFGIKLFQSNPVTIKAILGASLNLQDPVHCTLCMERNLQIFVQIIYLSRNFLGKYIIYKKDKDPFPIHFNQLQTYFSFHN